MDNWALHSGPPHVPPRIQENADEISPVSTLCDLLYIEVAEDVKEAAGGTLLMLV